MSMPLRSRVQEELNRRRELRANDNQADRLETQNCPFYLHSTQNITNFIHVNVMTHARLFQEILGLSAQGTLGGEHQKIAVVVNMYQKSAYRAQLLAKNSLLSKSLMLDSA